MNWIEREHLDNFTWEEKNWLVRDRLMSSWIGPDIKSVLDLGAGAMHLKEMISGDIEYFPVDYVARTNETLVYDFNQYEFPEINVDCVFCGGVLEYINDLKWFCRKISSTHCKYILLSYSIYTAEQSIENRRSKAWVNDLTFKELLNLFYDNGFVLTDWNKHFDYSPLLKFERLNPQTLTKNYMCTGCSACVEACNNDALHMGEDENGFYKPAISSDKCVNCGKCINVCHVIANHNDIKQNDNTYPIAYGFQGTDTIRRDCSSGGAFVYFAKTVLKEGGVVFGVSWNTQFNAHHIAIENENDLYLLQHSKYMQSFVGDSYKKALSYLEAGRLVLFSGSPCQIAGLKTFLKKDYGNLITIDVVCHYVPSHKFFDKYLDENFGKENVKKFTFRDKGRGWNPDHMKIELKDKKIIERNFDNDFLQKGFHPRLFMNDTCSTCFYADFPRQADITLGDFWGKVDDIRWNDGKGTSEVIINSERGLDLFNKISTEYKKCEKIAIEDTFSNRIKANYSPHSERDHFIELSKNNSFNYSVDAALNRKFSIGIVGDWNVENYGANITYFALYSYLHNQLGKDVLMIERPLSAPCNPNQYYSAYIKKPYPVFACEPFSIDQAGLFKLNNRCDIFLVGSDQLWNMTLYKLFGRFADLHWVDSTHLKIAYATSFGEEYISGSLEEKKQLKDWLQRFNSISVREDSAVKILKENFGINSTQVLDPVFICDKTEYEKLAKLGGSEELKKKNYIFSYILDIDDDKADLLNNTKNYVSADELIVVTDLVKDINKCENHFMLDIKTNVYEEEWLAYIINAGFFVTDSFHGMCMAIIFHIPFVAIINDGRGKTRFTSLAELLDINEYIAPNAIEAIDIIRSGKSFNIDWDKIDSILMNEALKSKAWLQNALSQKVTNNTKSSYDLLAPAVIAQEEHVNFIDNFTYIDVLPSQSHSNKRTRLAVGDQHLLFQVFDVEGNLEINKILSNAEEKYSEYDLLYAQQSLVIEELRSQLNQIHESYNQLKVDLDELKNNKAYKLLRKIFKNN